MTHLESGKSLASHHLLQKYLVNHGKMQEVQGFYFVHHSHLGAHPPKCTGRFLEDRGACPHFLQGL